MALCTNITSSMRKIVMKITGALLSIFLNTLLLGACTPEMGSKKWCEQIEDKPHGDWTVNEAKAFAKHCVFENYIGEED